MTIFGVEWKLSGFNDGANYSTQVDIDEVNELVTFIGTVNAAEIDNYSPRIEFVGNLESCVGLTDPASGEPPKGMNEVCVVTTPGAVTEFRLRLRDYVSGSFLNPDYNNPQEVLGAVVNFGDVNLIPSRIEAEEFVIDPSFTGSTIEVRIVLGADLLDDVNSPCVFPTDGDDGPSGGYDIDIDHYRNRAAAGTEALPDTL